jgi:hypothetical protein
MAAAAHNPSFAKKMQIPQSVAKEFNAADAGTGIIKGTMSKPPKLKLPITGGGTGLKFPKKIKGLKW